MGLDTQMPRPSTFWGSTGSGVVGRSWHWTGAAATPGREGAVACAGGHLCPVPGWDVPGPGCLNSRLEPDHSCSHTAKLGRYGKSRAVILRLKRI